MSEPASVWRADPIKEGIHGTAEVIVQCSECKALGYPNDKYCASCGHTLLRMCGQCGEPILHPVANYCTQCGAGLADEEHGSGREQGAVEQS